MGWDLGFMLMEGPGRGGIRGMIEGTKRIGGEEEGERDQRRRGWDCGWKRGPRSGRKDLQSLP